jgi:hypothetical protein
MIKPDRSRLSLVGMILLTALSLVFLMGDFCQDVLTIPIVVDYTGDNTDLTVDFTQANGGQIPEDGDFDSDVEIPDGDTDREIEFEIELDPEGYLLSPSHQSVNFTDESKGVPNLSQYKGNLDGIFIRSVTYAFVLNNIPGDIPPMDIFVSPRVQGDGADDSTVDWDALIASGELADLDMPENGIGDLGLVKLGQTERSWFHVPVKDFPTTDLRLVRQTSNLDLISETIMSNFAFEVLILPSAPIVIAEEDKELLPEDLTGRISISLRFVVVVAAKP